MMEEFVGESHGKVTGIIYRLNENGEGPDILQEVLEEKGWTEYDKNVHGEHEWNLWWRTSTFRPADFEKLQPWQRLNHHANTLLLTRKDSLARCLKRMRSVFGAHIYNFYPQTFNLPNEYARFVTEYSYVRRDLTKSCLWICKPSDLSRGRGIFLFSDISDLQYYRKAVVQQYISNPYLIGGYKFDLRLYVACSSLQPLTIYIYQEGLVRFATEKYDLSSLNNQFSHLTNTSINKYSPSYTVDKEFIGTGCKWTLTQLRHFLHQNDVNDRKLWSDIINIVIMTIIMQALQAETPSNKCFELYGFDVIIDENLKPWLLEVNYSPSLASDCQKDFTVKKPLLHDLLDLANFNEYDKENIATDCRSDTAAVSKLNNRTSSTSSHRMMYSGLGRRTLTTSQINLGNYTTHGKTQTNNVHVEEDEVTKEKLNKRSLDMPSKIQLSSSRSDFKQLRDSRNLGHPKLSRAATTLTSLQIQLPDDRLKPTMMTAATQRYAQNNASLIKSTAKMAVSATLSRSKSPTCNNHLKGVEVNRNKQNSHSSSYPSLPHLSACHSTSATALTQSNVHRPNVRRLQTQKAFQRSSATYSNTMSVSSRFNAGLPRSKSLSTCNSNGTDTERMSNVDKYRDNSILRDKVGEFMLVFPFNDTTRESHSNGTLDLHRTIRELPAIHQIRQQWHDMADRRYIPALARLWCPLRPSNQQ